MHYKFKIYVSIGLTFTVHDESEFEIDEKNIITKPLKYVHRSVTKITFDVATSKMWDVYTSNLTAKDFCDLYSCEKAGVTIAGLTKYIS